MALEITTLNGVDIIAQTFNAIAAMTANVTFFSMMYVAEVIGVVMCVLKYIKTRDLKTMGIWLISFVIINSMLLTPKVSVVINDKIQVTKVKKVDNVPVGVAAPFYLFSLGGNALSQMYDTFLAQPNDLQYTKTGLLFGQRLLDDSFNLSPASGEFNSNIGHFVEQCVIPDIQLNRKYTFEQLKHSNNLFNQVFHDRQSELRHVSYTSNSGSDNITCKAAAEKLKATLNKEISSGCANCPLSQMLRDFVSGRVAGVNNLAALQNSTQSIYSYFMGVSKSASDIFKQNMMINVMRKELSGVPASLDGSADMIAIASEQSLNKMRLAHQSSYQVANKMLPALYTVFSAFMIGIFPIIILAMFVTEFSAAIVKSYLGFLFSLMLYPVLFAIFNSFVNTLAYQQLQGQTFTLSNADTMKSNLTDIAGIASWLMLSIPFISFGLMKGLGQAVSSAGSYLGNALSSATTADASQISMGNMNWGNMQMENINGFKTNLNSEYSAGKSTVQNSDGSLAITNADGTRVHKMADSMSDLPFKVNWGNSISSSWNERSAMAIAQEARNSSGVRDSITKALSHISGYNSGHTHTSMTGSDTIDTSGFNKSSTFSENNRVNNNESAGENSSYSKDSSSGVKASVSVKGGANFFGSGGDAGLSGDSAVNENIKDNRHYEQLKSISDELQKGTSLAKVDGMITQMRNGTTDSNFITTLNNVQNEVRQAQDRYNEYVETESKSLNSSKEAILSETENINVSRNLDQSLMNYISANYTAEQQREILKAAPTQEGIRLQNEAIKAVTGEYIDKIVNDHHSNAEKLGEMYEVAPVSHSSYGQSQVVSAQPSNRGFNNPEPYSYEKPTYSGANSESSRQNEFEKEFRQMGENFERGKERAKHTQDMVTGNINSQRGYVGNIAESSKKVIDDAFDRK
ncbi:conjugal transfer protein TraG N-terminal domain-containing protein [Glaesserella parasuis]|uniref:conjugal transfer protein TraG N-terminal domain-containing protein n=2 Tax=Glaesserella parasuis TaxID=738 RepID=UPI00193BC351|nr:conjugal transfer protein TraG N-terminal domain-containing protein [Glaesserella parasuis]MDO9831652.1 conjugal transfer protein TraG N-terminal domain-containing protein [Glaesserella parasuis]MDO9874060.1 conjugal transfer protein TraG N-terminal domain-containing protein [Glaesserella parasuis]MDP0120186.1 conjugal transfer protein TraG N-terminal domain-containing protein [Glaesserella parasuis]QRI83836.1 conjugal transfer protein TraG N-terminal domain-containing protein [Glaesserella 